MKLAAPLVTLLTLAFACNRDAPVHAEVRNVSTSCQTPPGFLATGSTDCTTVAEVVLSGDTAGQHPWLAYLHRVVDSKEDETGTFMGVLCVHNSGKFMTTYRAEKGGIPQIGFKVLALEALTPVN